MSAVFFGRMVNVNDGGEQTYARIRALEVCAFLFGHVFALWRANVGRPRTRLLKPKSAYLDGWNEIAAR